MLTWPDHKVSSSVISSVLSSKVCRPLGLIAELPVTQARQLQVSKVTTVLIHDCFCWTDKAARGKIPIHSKSVPLTPSDGIRF